MSSYWLLILKTKTKTQYHCFHCSSFSLPLVSVCWWQTFIFIRDLSSEFQIHRLSRVLGVATRYLTQHVHISLTTRAPVVSFSFIPTLVHDSAIQLVIEGKNLWNLSLFLSLFLSKWLSSVNTPYKLYSNLCGDTLTCRWHIRHHFPFVDYCHGFSSVFPLARTDLLLISLYLVANFQNVNLIIFSSQNSSVAFHCLPEKFLYYLKWHMRSFMIQPLFNSLFCLLTILLYTFQAPIMVNVRSWFLPFFPFLFLGDFIQPFLHTTSLQNCIASLNLVPDF